LFGCVYSPAKKRGPNPGHKRKTDEEGVSFSSQTTCTTTTTTTNTTTSSSIDGGIEQQPRMIRLPAAAVLPASIAEQHSALLEPTNPVGNTLRSYYQLSINEMFCLPCTELSASKFAELALGALVKDDVSLAHELCNAVVHCLHEALRNDFSGSYDIAKTYYLVGVFRVFRGDFGRYFKYRRVCLTYLSKLPVSCLVVVVAKGLFLCRD
jgi:hypothetical protein